MILFDLKLGLKIPIWICPIENERDMMKVSQNAIALKSSKNGLFLIQFLHQSYFVLKFD